MREITALASCHEPLIIGDTIAVNGVQYLHALAYMI